jgi:hypothetical protein
MLSDEVGQFWWASFAKILLLRVQIPMGINTGTTGTSGSEDPI